MEILLYVYLAGWLGTSTYGVVQCQEPMRVITKGECRTIAVVAGAVWPVIVVNHLKEAE